MNGKYINGFIASLVFLNAFCYHAYGAAYYGFCENWEDAMAFKCDVSSSACRKCEWFGAMPFCADNYCPIGWKTCGWAHCGDYGWPSWWCCWPKNRVLCCP